MIMQGLFDKFPSLHVIIQEGGFWWLPEFMARADDYYLSHPGDIRLVERKLNPARNSSTNSRANISIPTSDSPASPCVFRRIRRTSNR